MLKKSLNKYLPQIRFVLLSLAFIILAIVTLIASRGNTITPEGIIQTGNIRLNIQPTKEISVFLNNKLQTVSDGSVLNNINPGTYMLRVQKQDYLNWEQEIKVEPGLFSTVNIQLIPNKFNIESITNKNVYDFSYTTSDKLYFTVKDSQIGNDLGIWEGSAIKPSFVIIPDTESKIINMSEAVTTAIASQNFLITASNNNQKLLIKLNQDYFVTNSTGSISLDSSNKLDLSFTPTTVSWLKDSTTLLIQGKNIIMEYEVQSKQKQVIFYADTLPKYVVVNNILYFITDQNLFEYKNKVATKVELSGIKFPTSILNLLASNSENIWLQTDTGVYFLNTKYSYFSQVPGNKLLLVSGSGLSGIITDANNIVHAIKVNISEINRSVSISDSVTQIPANIDTKSASWALNDSYLIFKALDSNIYMVSDGKGQNTTKLDLGSELQIIKAQILSNGDLVVLANSTSSTTDNLFRSSLLRLKLNN